MPFILGLILDIVGYRIGNLSMAKAGIMLMSYGTPAIMFILVVIGLILMITGRLSDDDARDTRSDERHGYQPETDGGISKAEERPEREEQAEKEAEKLADINSSYGYDSQMKLAEYQMDHVSNAYRNSSRREKILGWLFFGFLMTDFGMIMVFAFFGSMVGALVCMGIFAGTILLSLIIKVILEKTSMSKRINPDKCDICEGVVRACLLSSMGSVGGGHRHSTTRVCSVTYRIVVIVDGKDYNAYSRNFYNVGDKVTVAVKRSGRGVAQIIEKD